MPRKTLTLSAAALLMAGCTSAKYDQDFYDYDAQNSRARSLLEAQYAKGAADDKRMSAAHFDVDCELTALGREKLGRIVEGSPRQDLKVYLDFEPATPERGEAMVLAVREYLVDLGVTATPRAMDEMVVLGDPGDSYRAGDSLAAMRDSRRRNSAEIARPGLLGAK